MVSTFKDATVQEVERAMQLSHEAFDIFKEKNLRERAGFLRTIADEMNAVAKELIEIAGKETNLEEARLAVELKRTIFQLTSYAEACEQGTWLDIRIDTANTQRNPPKPDIRKMLVPLGPVVVFGASNFPFAYSTAGGDTATALAAGCTVVIKAHQAHAGTSELVAKVVQNAAQKCGLPQSVFIHLHGASFEVGKALVMHPLTKAVGFTGSYEGGMALFDMANNRPVPIPVFAEMGSINPVFILPQKLKNDSASIAAQYASSITQSVGQFCTNPGLLIAVEGEELDQFLDTLGDKIKSIPPALMLHAGIAKNFHQKRTTALQQDGVEVMAEAHGQATEDKGIPTLAVTTVKNFLNNKQLHKEVFGPYSLLVKCRSMDEMLQVAQNIEGQLTATLIATDEEVVEHTKLVHALQNICGRFILNGVPTGVEVALAMHHGGPFPATTDSRFTSVGADGIKRFARPIAYQNWPDILLPDELKNSNPLCLWRTVNNMLTKTGIE